MNKLTLGQLRPTFAILLLVIFSVASLFLWQSHKGLNLADEGYLWYGAQRVTMGEVPIRDFMAYDIGRYYWSAAFMSILGDTGIVTLRIGIAVFQASALFIGLALLTRNSAKPSLAFCLLAAITLIVWMFPQYRIFDISLPIILIGALTFLIQQPTIHRYFLTGFIVGLAAVFGRNHGMYGVIGCLCVIYYLNTKCMSRPPPFVASVAWISGLVIGYLPVMVFIVVVPGFALAFGESVRLLFEIKTTNYPLPVPWPWLAPFGKAPIIIAIRSVLEGVFFIAIAFFGLVGIAWVILKKIQDKSDSPMLIASICMALPYAHYAYSRADIEHLAPGIPPFLLGTLALLANQPAKIKWPFAALICGASLLLMLPAHPGWLCYLQPCVELNVAGDNLKIDRGTAGNLITLNTLAEQFAPKGQTFIAAPFWPGAYAALGRKSPVWEIYMLFPRNTLFQNAEIERIKAAKPGFAVILDFPLDGREELRFRSTHPIIDQYIRNNFIHLEESSKNPMFQIYRGLQNNP